MPESEHCPLCGAEWDGYRSEWSAGDYADHKGPSYYTRCCGAAEWQIFVAKREMPSRPGERQGERPRAPLSPTGRGRFGF